MSCGVLMAKNEGGGTKVKHSKAAAIEICCTQCCSGMGAGRQDASVGGSRNHNLDCRCCCVGSFPDNTSDQLYELRTFNGDVFGNSGAAVGGAANVIVRAALAVCGSQLRDTRGIVQQVFTTAGGIKERRVLGVRGWNFRKLHYSSLFRQIPAVHKSRIYQKPPWNWGGLRFIIPLVSVQTSCSMPMTADFKNGVDDVQVFGSSWLPVFCSCQHRWSG